MRTNFKVKGALLGPWTILFALVLAYLPALPCAADTWRMGAPPPPSSPQAIFNVTIQVTVKPDGDFAFATTIKNTDSTDTFQHVTLQNLAIIDVTKSPAYAPQNSPDVPVDCGDLAPGQSVTKTLTMPRHWDHAYDKYITIYRITYAGSSSGWPAGFETGNLIGSYLPAK